MNPLQTFEDYEIPTHSFVRAVRSLNDKGELSPIEYRERIKELTEVECKVDDKHIRFVYLYLVQETIRASYTTEQLNMLELFGLAVKRTEKFVNKNKWLFGSSERTIVKLDAAGNPKKKKGAKKELAQYVYAQNKHKQMSRKEWIALLVKEVGLTPPGASTYYANLKAGRY